MKPQRFELVGDFIAIRWEDGSESIVGLETARRNCRCAECAGEVDVTGRRHWGGPPKLGDSAFELVSWEPVGHYAVHLTWGDGHNTGIYTFDHLRGLGDADSQEAGA